MKIILIGATGTLGKAVDAALKARHEIVRVGRTTGDLHADVTDPAYRALIAKYGKLGHAYEYLGVANGHWLAVPVGWGSAPLTSCGRISLLKQFAGLDVQAMYPPRSADPKSSAPEWSFQKMRPLPCLAPTVCPSTW